MTVYRVGVRSSKVRVVLGAYDTDAIGVQEQSQRGKSPVQWTVGVSPRTAPAPWGGGGGRRPGGVGFTDMPYEGGQGRGEYPPSPGRDIHWKSVYSFAMSGRELLSANGRGVVDLRNSVPQNPVAPALCMQSLDHIRTSWKRKTPRNATQQNVQEKKRFWPLSDGSGNYS